MLWCVKRKSASKRVFQKADEPEGDQGNEARLRFSRSTMPQFGGGRRITWLTFKQPKNTIWGMNQNTPAPTPTPVKSSPGPSTSKELFRLRLKDRHEVREVIVEAQNVLSAAVVGQGYCEEHNYKYIRVEPMVVARD